LSLNVSPLVPIMGRLAFAHAIAIDNRHIHSSRHLLMTC